MCIVEGLCTEVKLIDFTTEDHKRMKEVDDDQSLSGPPQLLRDFSLPLKTQNDDAQSRQQQ